MSEKLDGVRCYWNGSNMYTRNGLRFFPPKWFTEKLPKEPLDGELFLERGRFEATVSIVRKQYEHDGWQDITYIVFDAPNINKPFNQRIKDLETLLGNCDTSYAKYHDHQLCTGKK